MFPSFFTLKVPLFHPVKLLDVMKYNGMIKYD